MSVTLRHPDSLRATRGKPAPRGASRLAAQEPVRARIRKPDLSWMSRVLWPVLFVVLGVGAYQGATQMLPYVDRPIAKVSVQGDLAYVTHEAVQRRIEPYTAGNFFSVDLRSMREELERMPWIAHAEVRRIWPDQIDIQLQEQLPIARWGDEALLNNLGQAFAPQELNNYQSLPRLDGPTRAQQKVMQQYQILGQLLRPLGFSVVALQMRERGSWFLTASQNATGQQIDLLLGRDHIVEKMRRFVAVYERELKDQITNIARIDLRYANGLSVAWHEPIEPAAAEQKVN